MTWPCSPSPPARTNSYGEFLHIGVNSVKDRLKNAFSRLGAANRTEAVNLARSDGLIDD